MLNDCFVGSQVKKWDLSFASVWNGVVWLMLLNFFGQIVTATAQRYLKKQQEKELDVKNEEAVVINIGRTPDVELYVNDEKLEYAISPNEVLSQLVTIKFTKTE